MYPSSFFFDVPSSAFVSLSCGNMFVGIVSTVATYVLELFDDDELLSIARILRKVRRADPSTRSSRSIFFR